MKRIVVWTIISLSLLILTAILDQSRSKHYKSGEINPAIFVKLEQLPDSCFNQLAKVSLDLLWQQKDRMDSVFYSRGIVSYGRNLYKGTFRETFEESTREMMKKFPYDSSYYQAFIEVCRFYVLLKLNDRVKDKMVFKQVFKKYFNSADSLKSKNPLLFNTRLPALDSDLEKLKWFILFYPINPSSK